MCFFESNVNKKNKKYKAFGTDQYILVFFHISGLSCFPTPPKIGFFSYGKRKLNIGGGGGVVTENQIIFRTAARRKLLNRLRLKKRRGKKVEFLSCQTNKDARVWKVVVKFLSALSYIRHTTFHRFWSHTAGVVRFFSNRN